MIKFIDLFCGMGGFRIAIENACKRLNIESKCVLSSDIKPIAIKAYSSNFDNDIVGDITQISTKDIPNFDLLCAGFPCQPFSSAGKQLGFEDTRGTLFFEIAKILKDKRPQYFILENVDGLLTHNNGKTFNTIYNILTDELNYNVKYRVLNAIDFGLPQNRKRLYIIGSTKELPDSVFVNKLFTNFVILDNIIDKEPNKDLYINTDFANKLTSHYPYPKLLGKSISDKRGGENNIHSWNIELRGPLQNDEKTILSVIAQERRKRYVAKEQGVEWRDGLGLTKAQIKKFVCIDDKSFENDITSLIQKGYIKETYPKKGNNYDYTKRKIYDLKTGKLSFPITYIFNTKWVAPTLTATDLSHMAISDEKGLRFVSKNELKKIFGFPNEYNLNECSLQETYDLFGNTICVNVVENLMYNVLSLS